MISAGKRFPTFSGWLHSSVQVYHSYRRFVELKPTVLAEYLRCRMGRGTRIRFVDSAPLAVCKNPRIHPHRVFADRAQRGHTSVGGFYGFKEKARMDLIRFGGYEKLGILPTKRGEYTMSTTDLCKRIQRRGRPSL